MHAHQQSCRFHAQNSSSWHCDSCGTDLCDMCVPFGHSPHWGRCGPRCPRCNRELSFSRKAQDIQPFWTLLPDFFRYPLHGNALGMIAMVTLLSIVLPALGLLAIPAFIFLVAITVKYSFIIIERRASNDTTPPSFSEVLERDEYHRFIKFVVVMIALFGAASYVSMGKPTLFNFLNGIITFILPAITIILAIEKSILRTLNPLIITAFIARVGWAYLLVWFCFQIVTSGPTYVIAAFSETLSIYLLVPISIVISLYFWFAANCMLGYTVYQYQDELGHAEAMIDSEDLDVALDTFEKKRALADAYIQVRENDAESARNTLRPMLDKYKGEKELHTLYHRILAILGDTSALKNHADYFIQQLLNQGDTASAAATYQDTLAKAPNYQPQDIDTAYAIAQALEDRGQRKPIAKLLNNIHKKDPRHPTVPLAYFLLAKNYREHLNDDEKALKIVDFLLTNYQQTPIRGDIIQYRKSFAPHSGI